MSTDQRISHDLAVVGRTSQLRPFELEATLRAAGAVARPEANGAVVAAIYIARRARVWGGAAAVVAVAWLVAHLLGTYAYDDSAQMWLWMPKRWLLAFAIGLALSGHAIGGWLAARNLKRGLDGAALRAAALRVGWRSAAASIAGAASVVLLCCMIREFLWSEMRDVVILADEHGDVLAISFPTAFTLIPALAACGLAAIVVGRLSSVPKQLAWIGVAMFVATFAVAYALDAGPLPVATSPISMSLRVVLTATGTIGLFLTIAGIVHRVHRREDALLR